MEEIILPINYVPRAYQLPILKALDTGIKRAVWVVHRRGGKDKTLVNFTAKKMFERVGVYYYLFPTYEQGRKVLWEGIDKNGYKFTDHFPKELRKRTDNQQMIIEMTNQSLFRVVGTDHIEALRGTQPIQGEDGCH